MNLDADSLLYLKAGSYNNTSGGLTAYLRHLLIISGQSQRSSILQVDSQYYSFEGYDISDLNFHLQQLTIHFPQDPYRLIYSRYCDLHLESLTVTHLPGVCSPGGSLLSSYFSTVTLSNVTVFDFVVPGSFFVRLHQHFCKHYRLSL